MALELREIEIPSPNEITSLNDLQKLDDLQKSFMRLQDELYVPINPDRYSPAVYYRTLASRYMPNSLNIAILNLEDESKLAAAVNFSRHGKVMEIHGIIVAEEYRRNKHLRVGTFAISSLAAIAKQARAKVIELDSNLTHEAEEFYNKSGFVKTGTTRRELKLT